MVLPIRKIALALHESFLDSIFERLKAVKLRAVSRMVSCRLLQHEFLVAIRQVLFTEMGNSQGKAYLEALTIYLQFSKVFIFKSQVSCSILIRSGVLSSSA